MNGRDKRLGGGWKDLPNILAEDFWKEKNLLRSYKISLPYSFSVIEIRNKIDKFSNITLQFVF